MKSTNSVIKLTVLKIAGVILGIAASILQVKLFGTSREIEAYFAASSLVYLIISLSQGGQLAELFVPIYHKLKSDLGKEVATKAFSVVVNHVLLFLLIFSFLAYFISPYLVKIIVPGFALQSQILASEIFRVLLCVLVIQVLNSFITTILNAEKVYGKAEYAALINNLVYMGCIVLFYQKLGIWTLVVSLMIGKIIEFTFSIFLLKKLKMKYFFLFKTEGFDKGSFFSALSRTFTYVSATQVYSIVLNASLSYLPQGVYAVFQYVQNLYSKVSTILIQPITMIYFTNISILRSKNKNDEFKELTKTSLNIFLIISAFSIIMFAVSGKEFVQIIWGGKKFDAESVNLAYKLFLAFFTTFLFQGAFAIYRKMAVTLGLAKKLYTYSAVSMILSASLTFILLFFWGLKGLYIVILFAKGFFMFVPITMVFFIKREYFVKPDKRTVLKIFVAGLLSGLGAFFLKKNLTINYFEDYKPYIDFFIGAVSCAGIFFIMLWVLNVNIFKDKVSLIFNKLILNR